MTAGEIVITIFIAFVSTGFGAMFWRRSAELHEDNKALRAEMNARFAQVDGRFGEVGDRLAALQSDLTHVALAVGAKLPRAEGE
ncbi:MAG: hypothetical protein ACRDKB_00680 [Actinomycetota bacterium]